MFFDGLFRHIGTVDVQPLARAIDSFGEDAWFEYVRRQERFKPHRDTQTIPLLFDEDMRHVDPTPWPRYGEIEPLLEPVCELIRNANPPVDADADPGYFIRIIVTRLSPDSYISPHQDFGDSMMRSHRTHLAISTNENVHFEIGGQVQHLAAGEIWEINNRRNHAVANAGAEPRIHLVLDYVVPGEKIHDPKVGWLVA
jgi:hypothetical protein